MKAIHRQVIDITDEQTISARGLSRVLAVDSSRSRHGKAEVWFETDSDKEEAEITLWTIGTGNLIPDEVSRFGNYVGHYFADNNRFVGHVYASAPKGQ